MATVCLRLSAGLAGERHGRSRRLPPGQTFEDSASSDETPASRRSRAARRDSRFDHFDRNSECGRHQSPPPLAMPRAYSTVPSALPWPFGWRGKANADAKPHGRGPRPGTIVVSCKQRQATSKPGRRGRATVTVMLPLNHPRRLKALAVTTAPRPDDWSFQRRRGGVLPPSKTLQIQPSERISRPNR